MSGGIATGIIESPFIGHVEGAAANINNLNANLIEVLSGLSTLSNQWVENPELEREFKFLVNLHSQNMHALAILHRMGGAR